MDVIKEIESLDIKIWISTIFKERIRSIYFTAKSIKNLPRSISIFNDLNHISFNTKDIYLPEELLLLESLTHVNLIGKEGTLLTGKGESISLKVIQKLRERGVDFHIYQRI